MRATNYEFAGWIDVENDVIIPEFFGDDGFDDMFNDLLFRFFANAIVLFINDRFIVLC